MKTTNKLPEDFKKKWIEALRSGEYKQGKGQLVNDKNEYCCLGVLCIIIGYLKDELGDKCYIPKDYELVPQVLRGASYDSGVVKILANMNDGKDTKTSTDIKPKTFSEIADYIEENL